MGVTRPEHSPDSTGKTPFSQAGTAISDAQSTGDDCGGFGPDLDRLVDAWSGLDGSVRRRILEIAGLM